jgi:PAS domain S-box-containing protein
MLQGNYLFLFCSLRLRCCIIKNRSIIRLGDFEGRMSTIKKAVGSKEDLKIRVKERTAELAAANEELQHRINERDQVRDALVKRSEMLEAFFKHSISPLVFLDKDFNFIRVNEAYARACDRDVSEFPGHNHFEFYPDKENEDIFRNVVETEVPFHAIAKPFIFPDHPEWGVTYWDWTLFPVLDDKGEVDFLVFSLEDVTGRKIAEEALQRSAEEIEDLYNNAPCGYHSLDKDGVFVRINDTELNWLGHTREEVVGKMKFPDILTPESLKIFRKNFPLFKSRGQVKDLEFEMMRKDGTILPVLLSATAIKDADGNYVMSRSTVFDITERKEVETRTGLTNVLLELFVRKSSRKEYIDAVVHVLQKWTACCCIGIRVVNDQGFIPYESYVGFSREFWKLENMISIKKDACACIRVVTGKFEPPDMCAVTPNGSFYLNDSAGFLNKLSKEEAKRFRGNCIRSGFLSIAIVPVRYREETLGAIHLADKKEAMLPLKVVRFIESMAPLIGEAVHRFNTEEELRRTRDGLEMRVEERTRELVEINNELEGEIGERRRAEEKINRLSHRNELILNSAGEGILGLNPDGVHLFVNPVAAKMLGYRVEELVGMSSHNIWHHSRPDGSPYPEHACPIHTTLLDGKVHYNIRDEVFWRKDGTNFPVTYTSTPIKEDGRLVGAVVTFRDVTEIKKAEEELVQLTEELKRSNADLEQFAYAASHDLQEPLRVVAGFVKLLEKRYKGRLDEKADEFIEYTIDGVTRMQALIKDLLDYSQVGTKGKRFTDTDCTLMIGRAVSNLKVAIEESRATVTHDDLPHIMADSSQLVRLFQNLIGNAIKFRAREKPKIHISARREDQGWLFSVRDNGIGIEPGSAERIFVVFQRLHAREEYPGTGIGLAVCKKIVERHGGHIWVESKPGNGSTFYFTIPDREAR